MTPRRGFGDETWRLARTGDVAALDQAAAVLLADEGEVEYEGRRALAFRDAIDGRRDAALAELNQGWSEDWPPPSAYALDVSRIHLLSGDCDSALSALLLEMHNLEHWSGVHEVVAECVRREPRLWRRGLRLALAAEAGRPGKLRAAVAVGRARLGRRRQQPEALPRTSPES